MEKILLAIDAKDPNVHALDFACYIGRVTKSAITGVFLENLLTEEKLVFTEEAGVPVANWEPNTKAIAPLKEKTSQVKDCIEWFKQGCVARDVRYKLHRDRGMPAEEMIAESRYADMIIIDPATSFRKTVESVPTEFTREILKNTECPVIIAPENFEGIDEVIFSYNKSESCLFAMKQFTYLFPDLGNKKVKVITFNRSGTWEDHDKYIFTEWLNNHYADIEFLAVKDEISHGMAEFLHNKKNAILVMGSYGRTTLSLLFEKSQSDKLMRILNNAIFISHL